MFLNTGRGAPTAPALIEGTSGETVSYERLGAKVAEIARFMAADRGLVFLLCRNDLPTALTYLGAVEAGHVVALLDARLEEGMLRKLVARYRPQWIAGGDGPGDGEWSAVAVPGAVRVWRATVAGAEPGHDRPHPELTLLLSTSGSTGSPKFVRLSRRAVEANAASIVQALGIGPDERAVASLPLHYSYGLSVLNSHLAAGAAVVLTDESVMTPSFWDLVARERCTSMAGVPISYQMLDRLGFARVAPPTLRTLTQAGGALAPAFVERFHRITVERGGRFFVMYGQTEATARMTTLPAQSLSEKLGSVGVAVPQGRVEIERHDGQSGPGLTGEIVYTGPNVMMGYAESRADLVRGDDLQGRLRTGDLGHLDADGYLFVTGRTARIAKVFGVRVSLDDIEGMIGAHGPTAAVAGADKIVLHCAFGTPELFAQLSQELGRTMHLGHRAFDFRRRDALPLTERGKVDYVRLKEEP